MKRHRGQLPALAIGTSGIVFLIVASVALTGPLLEEWYIRDLERYDEHRSRVAAEWLGQNGSVRAMRRLFQVLRRLALLPDAENTSSGTCNSIVRTCQAVEGIVDRRRKEVVPLLVSLLEEKPPAPLPGNEVRIGAANLLGRLGQDAGDAVPALRGALTDDEERFREVVARALARIEGQE